MTINQTHSNGCYWLRKRYIGNIQRQRSTYNSRYIRGIIIFYGQHRSNDMNIITETPGKQRANRTVNQTSRQRCHLRGTTFTFNKPTWNLTNCILFFLIIYRKWEKVDTFTGFFRYSGCHQQYSITIANHSSTVSLISYLSYFNN